MHVSAPSLADGHLSLKSNVEEKVRSWLSGDATCDVRRLWGGGIDWVTLCFRHPFYNDEWLFFVLKNKFRKHIIAFSFSEQQL